MKPLRALLVWCGSVLTLGFYMSGAEASGFTVSHNATGSISQAFILREDPFTIRAQGISSKILKPVAFNIPMLGVSTPCAECRDGNVSYIYHACQLPWVTFDCYHIDNTKYATLSLLPDPDPVPLGDYTSSFLGHHVNIHLARKVLPTSVTVLALRDDTVLFSNDSITLQCFTDCSPVPPPLYTWTDTQNDSSEVSVECSDNESFSHNVSQREVPWQRMSEEMKNMTYTCCVTPELCDNVTITHVQAAAEVNITMDTDDWPLYLTSESGSLNLTCSANCPVDPVPDFTWHGTHADDVMTLEAVDCLFLYNTSVSHLHVAWQQLDVNTDVTYECCVSVDICTSVVVTHIQAASSVALSLIEGGMPYITQDSPSLTLQCLPNCPAVPGPQLLWNGIVDAGSAMNTLCSSYNNFNQSTSQLEVTWVESDNNSNISYECCVIHGPCDSISILHIQPAASVWAAVENGRYLNITKSDPTLHINCASNCPAAPTPHYTWDSAQANLSTTLHTEICSSDEDHHVTISQLAVEWMETSGDHDVSYSCCADNICSNITVKHLQEPTSVSIRLVSGKVMLSAEQPSLTLECLTPCPVGPAPQYSWNGVQGTVGEERRVCASQPDYYVTVSHVTVDWIDSYSLNTTLNYTCCLTDSDICDVIAITHARDAVTGSGCGRTCFVAIGITAGVVILGAIVTGLVISCVKHDRKRKENYGMSPPIQ